MGSAQACISCNLDGMKNCEACSFADSEGLVKQCTKCKSGTTLSDGKCFECTQTGCKECKYTSSGTTDKKQRCTACAPGYKLQDGVCLPCKDKNCL